jgi:C-terminal processing protease CtpA/Prc
MTLLYGSVHYKDEPGWIGFRWNDSSHIINKIFLNTPASELGLQVKDHVLSLDPMNGVAGEPVTIKIQRGTEILEFRTWRVVIKK